jgi:hypothetical protein
MEHYRNVGYLLDLMHSKGRRALKKHRAVHQRYGDELGFSQPALSHHLALMSPGASKPATFPRSFRQSC